MGTTLAVAGKGGVGKTSIAALMIKALVEYGKRPILAIDADSNSNLHEVLGIGQPRSVGCVREDVMKFGDKIPSGMTKDRFLEFQIQASLVEGKDIDFLSMGRPEGPGCYCLANNILREVISRLTSNYGFVVIDNEAGLEHLSRRTDEEVDHLFVISDPLPRSLRTVGRIADLIDELKGRVHEKHLVLSRVRGNLPPAAVNEIERLPYRPDAQIPYDDELVKLDLQGKPLLTISENSPSYRAVTDMLRNLGLVS